jgi:hypothetical protein
LTVVEAGKEEQDCDREMDRDPLPSICMTHPPKSIHADNRKTPQQQSMKHLTKELAESRAFTFQWGKQASEKVDWNILANHEVIYWGTPNMSSNKATDKITFGDDTDLGDLFFDKISLVSRNMPS